MKKSTARRINAGVWAAVAAAIMICAYCAWSKNGDYTLFSFFASLVFHGGFSLVIGMQVDEFICRKYNNK